MEKKIQTQPQVTNSNQQELEELRQTVQQLTQQNQEHQLTEIMKSETAFRIETLRVLNRIAVALEKVSSEEDKEEE